MKYTLQATTQMKEVMKTYFQSFGANPKPLVAWCTSVGPAELLRAFGFEVYFPENHGALLGATRLAGEYIPVAASEGYSNDICSYLTADIGAFKSGSTPLMDHYGLKGIPQPDLIVYSTNQCREVQDWFEFFGKKFSCPTFGIFPPRHIDAVGKAEIADVAAQYRNLALKCEEVAGQKFQLEKFQQTLELSIEAGRLWKAVLETAKASPAPLSFWDGVIHMGPIVVLRGTQQAVDYYRLLLNELEGNIQKGIGVLEKEQSRIYWDGMPIWGKLRPLSNLFHQNNSVVVASTYCNSWVFDAFDSSAPFESSAKAYTEIFINRSEKAKLEILADLGKQFRIDGFIFHDAKTCFNNSNTRFGLPARLSELTGIPSLIVEGDLCDLRFYSEGQTETKIETFLSQISAQFNLQKR